MKFRKKPVVIEAFQITRETRADNRDWPEWLNRAWNEKWPNAGAVSCEDYPTSGGDDRLLIATLEGPLTVGWDDWIIQGVKGELYPCKPDIFAATYEPAVTVPLRISRVPRDSSADEISEMDANAVFDTWGDAVDQAALRAHTGVIAIPARVLLGIERELGSLRTQLNHPDAPAAMDAP